MKKRHSLRNQKGFTLIELISIMIILGVLGSVAIRKYDNLTNTANGSVLAVTVEELNARESLIWANMKISNEGYTNDTDVLYSAKYRYWVKIEMESRSYN
jgi:prepilin-type N-terminal cleavage/methylation domain-containing protein